MLMYLNWDNKVIFFFNWGWRFVKKYGNRFSSYSLLFPLVHFTIDMPIFPVFIQDISIDSAMCMSDKGLYNFFQTTIASIEYIHPHSVQTFFLTLEIINAGETRKFTISMNF